jgi:3-oxoacyl-[acyl-carrier protein] reductase
MPEPHVLIFGGSGAIGAALAEFFGGCGWRVTGVSRSAPTDASAVRDWIRWECGAGAGELARLDAKNLHAVVWAQGMNCNDDIRTVDFETHAAMYRANVLTIIESLQCLLAHDALAFSARLCVISSIWQMVARQNKLSYCVTKSALQGLVQSLAMDLGPSGFLVNAVMPGALDTPMTRANLAPEQIARIKDMTPLRSMPELSDVCGLVEFLCSERNTGLTGQFIAADRGFSHAKYI